jgi:hypothetical protein
MPFCTRGDGVVYFSQIVVIHDLAGKLDGSIFSGDNLRRKGKQSFYCSHGEQQYFYLP